jgi:hypothetical protein
VPHGFDSRPTFTLPNLITSRLAEAKPMARPVHASIQALGTCPWIEQESHPTCQRTDSCPMNGKAALKK